MKKLLAVILLSSLFLSGCSNNKTSSEFFLEIPEGFSFKINNSGIEISKDGELIQTIETDYLKNYPENTDSSPETHLVSDDYDFDGYKDLFIPSDLTGTNISGTYYIYNPETNLFELCEELNKRGFFMSVSGDETLRYSLTDENSKSENIIYKWDNSILKPVSHEIQYPKDESGSVYVDTFSYDNNENEIFIKREQLLTSDDGSSERKEVSISSFYKFKPNGNNIDVMLGDKVIQTLECDYTPDENKIESYDYDFDGNNDLFVSMQNGATYSQGTYFRYNSFTKIYENWDELNSVGRELAIDNENECLYWVDDYSKDYRFEKFVYEWKHQKIILCEHIVGKEDSGGLWTETYSANDKLISHEKTVYDENGNKTGTFNPDDIYFKVDKSGLDVMILGYDEPLQHISGNFYYNLSKLEYAPEYYVSQEAKDFDSDGFDDLFIPENNLYDSKGVYYRFNPETFKFEYWTELNKIGKKLQGDDEYYIFSIENNIRETITYKWYGDKFMPYKKTVNRVDTVNRTTIIENYDIDYYGNETLSNSYEANIPSAPSDNYTDNNSNNSSYDSSSNNDYSESSSSDYSNDYNSSESDYDYSNNYSSSYDDYEYSDEYYDDYYE